MMHFHSLVLDTLHGMYIFLHKRVAVYGVCVFFTDSCNQLYIDAGSLPSGLYQVEHNGRNITVYCLFKSDYGYTFISPDTIGNVNMSAFHDDSSHVLIRHVKNDGNQYEAKVGQITQYRSVPVSVQFNSHVGYQGHQRTDMSPYLFVGFIPEARTSRYDIQGWNVEDDDVTFTNCDGNPNSYFVVLFNHNNQEYSSYSGGGYFKEIMFAWSLKSNAVVTGDELPDGFYAPEYEIHHGGCGGYSTGSIRPQINGVAIGVKFSECFVSVQYL